MTEDEPRKLVLAGSVAFCRPGPDDNLVGGTSSRIGRCARSRVATAMPLMRTTDHDAYPTGMDAPDPDGPRRDRLRPGAAARALRPGDPRRQGRQRHRQSLVRGGRGDPRRSDRRDRPPRARRRRPTGHRRARTRRRAGVRRHALAFRHAAAPRRRCAEQGPRRRHHRDPRRGYLGRAAQGEARPRSPRTTDACSGNGAVVDDPGRLLRRARGPRDLGERRQLRRARDPAGLRPGGLAGAARPRRPRGHEGAPRRGDARRRHRPVHHARQPPRAGRHDRRHRRAGGRGPSPRRPVLLAHPQRGDRGLPRRQGGHRRRPPRRRARRHHPPEDRRSIAVASHGRDRRADRAGAARGRERPGQRLPLHPRQQRPGQHHPAVGT